MHAWDRFCVAVWLVGAARTVAFRGDWNGYLWTPRLHADSWYRLTVKRCFPNHRHLPSLWYAELFLLLLATTVSINTPIAIAAHCVRVFTARLWWILFLELKTSWTLTLLLPATGAAADAVTYLEIRRARVEPLYAPQILLSALLLWTLHMNLYARCVAKRPTTGIQYKARSSRLPV